MHSNMTYCLTMCGGASFTLLNPLIVVQKNVNRAINGFKTTKHINDSFISLKLSKFKDFYNFVCSVYTYKCLHDFISSPGVSSVPQTSPILEDTISGSVLPWFHLPSPRTMPGIVVQLIQGHPPEIKGKATLNSFKSCLKSYLISSYCRDSTVSLYAKCHIQCWLMDYYTCTSN